MKLAIYLKNLLHEKYTVDNQIISTIDDIVEGIHKLFFVSFLNYIYLVGIRKVFGVCEGILICDTIKGYTKSSRFFVG